MPSAPRRRDYDAAFVALAAQQPALPQHWFNSGRVWLAEVDGEIAGVCATLHPDSTGVAELEHLFIHPSRFGEGIGAALLAHVTMLARNEGAKCLQVLSDPQARAFYERFGFNWIKDGPSDAIPGRTLPILVLRLWGVLPRLRKLIILANALIRDNRYWQASRA